MNEIVGFNYNGAIVPFELTGNDVMINATAIIKIFPNKRINDFLSNKQTKDLIKQMKDEMSVAGISVTDLVVTIQGGIPQNQGTWMHRKIAIAFAMWCSPAFYSWCLEKLDEIINRGFALRDNQIANLQAMITANQPKVDYCENILNTSEVLYTTTDILNSCGFRISVKDLLSVLRDNGYIYDQSGKWQLRNPWSKQGYIRDILITGHGGKQILTRRWTEAGRFWLCAIGKQFGLI